jgi:cyclase
VSSPFHDPFSKGNLVYGDVFKIGHENYRAGLIDQMRRGNLAAEEQRIRLPNATFRDRMTLYLGGKEIQVLHFGAAHTKGDSVLFVPQDRIVYMSEVFFNEEFPNMAAGYRVSWIRVLDAVRALDADIFIPGHGPIPGDPKQTRAALDRARQILMVHETASRTRLHGARRKIKPSRRSSSSSTRSCRRTLHRGKWFYDESTKS